MSTPAEKRRSLYGASPSSASGPRPLQLASGSAITGTRTPSASSSSSASPIPTLSSRPRTPNPATLDDVLDHRIQTSSLNSPSPLSPSAVDLKKGRRQSSLSYFSSNRPNDVDYDTIRSPLSARSTLSLEGGGLSRSNSSGTGAVKSPLSRRPISAGGPQTRPGDARERPPLTLAEKHAELLHFIAQKEAKCLELRSQLAVHESELLQMKKKWERIVNKGLATNPNSPASVATPGSSNPNSFLSSSTSFYPALASPAVPNTIGLGGLKEGVQGMGRMIAAGLETITQTAVGVPSTPSSSSHPAPSVASPNSHAASAPSPISSSSAVPTRSLSARKTGGNRPLFPQPLHLQLGSSSNWDATGASAVQGHTPKESQSSLSTSGSTNTRGTRSSVVSSARSSMTSESSLAHDTFRQGTTQNSDATKADSEFGDFESGSAFSKSSETEKEDQDLEILLMVRDTGATPTMSPNPEFHRRKQKERERRLREQERECGQPVTPNPKSSATSNATKPSDSTSSPHNPDFDWNDAWGDPNDAWSDVWDDPSPSPSKKSPAISPISLTTPTSSSSLPSSHLHPSSAASARKQTSGPQTRTQPQRQKPTTPASPPSSFRSLPGASSIPGLSSFGIGMTSPHSASADGTPSSPPSSWMGNVGMKLVGEIQKNTTFTKSQKRASLLLNDVSQSIALVLGTSVPPSSAGSDAASTKSRQPAPSPSARTTSLLDDDEDDVWASTGQDMEGDDTIKMGLGSMSVSQLSPTPYNYAAPLKAQKTM